MITKAKKKTKFIKVGANETFLLEGCISNNKPPDTYTLDRYKLMHNNLLYY